MAIKADGHHAADAPHRSRIFKLLRRGLTGAAGMRSKHGAGLALDILEANGIDEIALPRPDGRLIHISTRDKVISSEVLRLGSFGRDNMDAFVALLKASDLDPSDLTFVNIGANIGTACLNAYSHGFRRLVAVEPEPRNFSLLERNLGDLPGASVRCMQLAIGDAQGRAVLHRHGRNLGSHSLLGAVQGRPSDDAIEVPVDTLSAVVDPREAFVLFIDVEGFEPQVLRGGAETIARGCAGIAMEITPSRYAESEAADLCARTSALTSSFVLLPSRDAHRSEELPRLMARRAHGHFDIAFVVARARAS